MRVTHNGNNSIPTSAPDARSAETAKARATGRQGEAKRVEQSGDLAPSAGGTKLDISTRAREFAKAKGIAASAPDVREDKIADLKRRIAEGKYNVDSDGIAERMVSDHLHMGIG